MSENFRNYYKEYLKTHGVYQTRKLKTIETLIEEIPIIEECIGFQSWLDDLISKCINDNEEEFRKINQETPNVAKQIVIGFSLFRRNHQYIYSAYELAYAGLCEPSYNIMRTVHETILSIWYIATHQNESTSVQEYMFNHNRKGKKYDHNHFVQSLYVGELEKSMRDIYAGLSVKAHSNIFGMKNTEQYSVEQIKDCFWTIKIQSFYNIIANIENLAQNSMLRSILSTNEVITFIERLKNDMGGIKKTIADYFPNKDNLKDSFYLYQPN